MPHNVYDLNLSVVVLLLVSGNYSVQRKKPFLQGSGADPGFRKGGGGGVRTFRRGGGFVQEFQERIQIVAGPWANQQAKKIADSRRGGFRSPKKKPCIRA